MRARQLLLASDRGFIQITEAFFITHPFTGLPFQVVVVAVEVVVVVVIIVVVGVVGSSSRSTN